MFKYAAKIIRKIQDTVYIGVSRRCVLSVDLVREAAHEYTVTGQLTHIDAAKLPHLSRDAVLLDQRFL